MDLYCIELPTLFSPYLTFDGSTRVMHSGEERSMEGCTWLARLDTGEQVRRSVVHVYRTSALTPVGKAPELLDKVLDLKVTGLSLDYRKLYGKDPVAILLSLPPNPVFIVDNNENVQWVHFSLGLTALGALPSELRGVEKATKFPSGLDVL